MFEAIIYISAPWVLAAVLAGSADLIQWVVEGRNDR